MQHFASGKNERFARETATDGSQSGCLCCQRFRMLGTTNRVFSLILEPKKWCYNNNKKVSGKEYLDGARTKRNIIIPTYTHTQIHKYTCSTFLFRSVYYHPQSSLFLCPALINGRLKRDHFGVYSKTSPVYII